MRFVLGSASPARLQTLRSAGVEPEVIVSDVDESLITAPNPSSLVGALAEAKARAVAGRVEPGTLVLGCDSMLEFDGEVLGKPGDADVARQRWRRMRGRSGTLHTGHCLLEVAAGGLRRAASVASTTVHFAEPSDDELEDYIASGEPLRVAGAFTIDGLGGWFIRGIEGDHHNVVGLSLPVLRDLLAELGYRVADLRT